MSESVDIIKQIDMAMQNKEQKKNNIDFVILGIKKFDGDKILYRSSKTQEQKDTAEAETTKKDDKKEVAKKEKAAYKKANEMFQNLDKTYNARRQKLVKHGYDGIYLDELYNAYTRIKRLKKLFKIKSLKEWEAIDKRPMEYYCKDFVEESDCNKDHYCYYDEEKKCIPKDKYETLTTSDIPYFFSDEGYIEPVYNPPTTATRTIRFIDLQLLFLIYSHKTALLFYKMLENKLYSIGYDSDKSANIYMTSGKKNYQNYKNKINRYFMDMIIEKGDIKDFKQVEPTDWQDKYIRRVFTDVGSFKRDKKSFNRQKLYKTIEGHRYDYMKNLENMHYHMNNYYKKPNEDYSKEKKLIKLRPLTSRYCNILNTHFIKEIENTLNENGSKYVYIDRHTNKLEEVSKIKVKIEVVDTFKLYLDDNLNQIKDIKLLDAENRKDSGLNQHNILYDDQIINALRLLTGKDKNLYKPSISKEKSGIFYDLHKQLQQS